MLVLFLASILPIIQVESSVIKSGSLRVSKQDPQHEGEPVTDNLWGSLHIVITVQPSSTIPIPARLWTRGCSSCVGPSGYYQRVIGTGWAGSRIVRPIWSTQLERIRVCCLGIANLAVTSLPADTDVVILRSHPKSNMIRLENHF